MKKKAEGKKDKGTTALSRRACIKTLGAGVSLLAVESGTATATSHGYGAGGYGDGEYGDPNTSLTVTTDAVSGVNETTATLDGSLTDLGGASSADVYFQYRQATATTWNSTAMQTFSSTSSFTADLTGLNDGAAYEFRAVASASDGSLDSGSTSEFTTVDDPVVVSTDGTVDVAETTATLDGSLTDLGGASSVDVYFQHRQATATTWSSTAVQTFSSVSSFTADLTGLSDGVAYEFRAVASASDGDSDSGSTTEFITVEDSVVVSTDGAVDVAETTATLTGSVTDLGNASSADVTLDYRATGQTTWISTAAQTLSSTGGFSASVTDLSAGTEYEFRATADASDGDTDTGGQVTFTTVTAESDPVIDSYSVSEAGSPNPHAEISADWAVSDADGDLSAVTVSVSDSHGATVRSSETSVSGGSAAGSESFKIKHGGGVYDVTLRVEDSAGNAASETKSVAE